MVGKWLWRLAAWDGLVPVAVLSAPLLLRMILPDLADFVVLAAVALPLVVLFVRFGVGKQHILLNRCSDTTRHVQAVALCLGIFLMLFMDALMLLIGMMPQGMAALTAEDFAIAAAFYAVYLACMSIAMYPGRKGCRNRLDPLDWLSAAVICNGRVVCKPLFTVELTDADLPDICYRMKLIRSSMACAQLEGGSSSDALPDSLDSLDRLDEAIRRNPDIQLAEWLDVIAQFGADYQLDGEAPIELNPRVDPDAMLRFDDARGQEPA